MAHNKSTSNLFTIKGHLRSCGIWWEGRKEGKGYA